MCQRVLVQRQWVRQCDIHADEETDLGLPAYRVNTFRHSTRQLIQLPASRRTHFYHAFVRVVLPTTPSVL